MSRRYGAIDIGSNAVRLMVKAIREEAGEVRSDKVAYTRIPIRLGEDVFETGRISPAKQEALTLAIEAFHLLLRSMGVKDFRACATSAMREAANGPEVVEAIRKRTGITIDIIRGREEADLIFSNFSIATLDRDRDYVYVDVGGGSTEITLIRQGERVEAKSFRIGSVRLLKDKVKLEVREGLEAWCRELMSKHDVADPIVIGSGGNINRLYKLSGGAGTDPITRQALESTYRKLKKASHAERLDRYGLKPDRADVIVPACRIYLDAMDLFEAETIIVPKVGLGDGMVLDLHRSRTAG